MRNISLVVPTLAKGGAEKVASTLATGLSKKYNLTAILLDGSKIDYPYEGNIIDLGIRSILNRNFLTRVKDIFKATVKLRKARKNLKSELSISFLELANIPSILAGFSKSIVSVHEFKLKSTDANLQSHIAYVLMKILYKKAFKIIVVSKGIKQHLIDDFGMKPDKIKVLYNPIDVEEIKRLKEEEIDRAHERIFSFPVAINIGRLTTQKGQWHLIRSWRKVRDAINAKLVILGDGELKEYLINLVNKLGLERDVFFLGFQKNPFKFIHRSSFLVFPSLWEGLPNVLVEALACGVPVISSDCRSGPREILAPDTDFRIETKVVEYAKYGIILPVCDGIKRDANEPLTKEEDLLANTIIEMFKNKSLREKYVKVACERARHFDAPSIISQWEELIEEAFR